MKQRNADIIQLVGKFICDREDASCSVEWLQEGTAELVSQLCASILDGVWVWCDSEKRMDIVTHLLACHAVVEKSRAQCQSRREEEQGHGGTSVVEGANQMEVVGGHVDMVLEVPPAVNPCRPMAQGEGYPCSRCSKVMSTSFCRARHER